jgi:branched-chain amino acid transport system substrate-binding protein
MFKKIKHILIAAALIIAALFVLPYVPNVAEMGDQRTAILSANNQQSMLIVGVSWPIEKMGPELINGIKLAIEKINRSQLLEHKTITLVIRDDQASNKEAQAIASDFAAMENMSAVIGFAHNHQVAATIGILQSAQLLQLVVGGTNIALARHKHPYVIQLTPPAKQIAQSLADSISQTPTKFAVLTQRKGYETSFAEAFTIALQNRGAKRVYNQNYNYRVKADFVRYSYQIKSEKPDVVLFSGSTSQAAQFAQQAHSIGLSSPILCTCNDIKVIQGMVADNKQSISLPLLYRADLDNQANQQFVSAYQQRFGTVPNQWAAQGYDSMLILATSIAQTNSLKPLDLSWSISSIDTFNGVSGQFKFSADGQLIDKPIYVHTFNAQ